LIHEFHHSIVTKVDRLEQEEASKLERLHVVIGIIINSDNQCCIAKRAKHAHLGGFWEFPGGKVEPDEAAQDALARELYEELGIIVDQTVPFMQISHDYEDRKVLLDFWLVKSFKGEPRGKEGQPVKWANLVELQEHEFPEANKPVIGKLMGLYT
jgi:8-oxo-dGTP diphosphatase